MFLYMLVMKKCGYVPIVTVLSILYVYITVIKLIIFHV